MVLKIFTREDAPEMREAIEFGKRLEEDGFSVEYYDADSEDSTQQIELYDVYSYPSFVVAKDDGIEVECWRGKKPLEYDVKMYLGS